MHLTGKLLNAQQVMQALGISRGTFYGNRTVDVWKVKPGVADNHWLDCLVGNAVAGALRGCSLPGMEAQSGGTRQRERCKLSTLQRGNK